MRDEFLQLLVRRYGAVKTQFPGEGRRKWNLRVLQEFWASATESDISGPPTALAEEFLNDDDPFDDLIGDGPQLGLLLRTDFSSDDAWQTFCPPPHPPAGTKRYSPPNRLVDKKGWQEIYTGLTIWIYDAQSNNDQCARLVSQEGDVYGTATGDSWRARVTHLCELQFNMTHLDMKIDFGGMDRYDYPERRRNLEKAETEFLNFRCTMIFACFCNQWTQCE
ncbi:hypothetical protein MVEN_00553900 [Mycena venus]|uniref:Uncharacterized protein n=1 Tax=Mycena venus TaxID=2733690 RepID=A0A8H7D7V9_9AGAR|nr:hypothetical protein MVEN_00553900 [Mycena venus]